MPITKKLTRVNTTLIKSGSFTGSFLGTSSYARRAVTASYALNASGGGGGTSIFTGSTYPITASRAITSSYAINTLLPYNITILSGTSINWTNNTFEKDVSTSETYTFSNVQTGSSMVVILNNTGSSTVLPVFPTQVRWANSLVPTQILSNATSIYTFIKTRKYILASSTENYL